MAPAAENARERLRYMQMAPPPAPRTGPRSSRNLFQSFRRSSRQSRSRPSRLSRRPRSSRSQRRTRVRSEQGHRCRRRHGQRRHHGQRPGTGGGVGSGNGTGKGSGNGPEQAAGTREIFPPTVIALTILPIPVPRRFGRTHSSRYFDVDTLGNATLLSFNPSKDGGYNKRIREMLSEIRFRPAVRGDGRPVRDTAQISAAAP